MNVVITTFTNSVPDPQRGYAWAPNVQLLAALHESLCGDPLVVLTDCLDGGLDNTDFVRIRPGRGRANPYFLRWIAIADYLREHDDIHRVWCVDGTDVVMLHEPWDDMVDGVIYLGSEEPQMTVGIPWMAARHRSLEQWCNDNADLHLLNAGLLGGDRVTVLDFVTDLCDHWPNRDLTDMAAFNYVAYSDKWRGRWVTGDVVHTEYRSYSRNDHSWWAHK